TKYTVEESSWNPLIRKREIMDAYGALSQPGSPAVPAPPARPRHPLGLPAGSIRALLTFLILGTIAILLLMPKEKGIQVPPYLYYLTLLVIGSYFGARSHTPRPADSLEWSPLFLPRGSIRLLIILGFFGVLGWGYYQDRSFFDNIKLDQVA